MITMRPAKSFGFTDYLLFWIALPNDAVAL
jgi:hypothetical protein